MQTIGLETAGATGETHFNKYLWAGTRGPPNFKSETRTEEVKKQECRLGLNLKNIIERRGKKKEEGPEGSG